MTRYLIHNVYGDADDLIATMPQDVEAVSAGWDADSEAARNALFASLGIAGVSALPALLYHVDEQATSDPYDGDIAVPAHWAELRIADLPKPWNWSVVDAATAGPQALFKRLDPS
jgi:hypothetical protein